MMMGERDEGEVGEVPVGPLALPGPPPPGEVQKPLVAPMEIETADPVVNIAFGVAITKEEKEEGAT